MKILAFIPARANSKRIKNKNMALLNKKPLIYYTLNILKKIKKDNIDKDLENLLKKIKKDKKYFFSTKDIIMLEALRYDGVNISKKYKNK